MKISDLIRELPAREKPNLDSLQGKTYSETILTARQEEWKPRGIFGGNPPSDAFRFVIVHNEWSDWITQPHQYSHGELWHALSLKLQFRVMVPLGNALAVSKSFWRNPPLSRIERKLQERIHKTLYGNFEKLIQNQQQGIQSLQTELVSGLAEFGLDAEVRVEIAWSQQPSIQLVEFKQLTLRFKDYDHDLTVGAKLEVKPNPSKMELAKLAKVDIPNFTATAKDILLSKFREMSLQEFLERSMGGSFEAACSALTASLGNTGRLIERLDITLPDQLRELLRNGLPTRSMDLVANDLPGQTKLNLKISYWGRVASTDFGKAAKALGLQPRYDRINDWLRELVANYWASQLPRLQGFLLEFLESPSGLCQYLETQLSALSGMQMKVSIKIDEIDPPLPLRILNHPILARPQDLHNEIEFLYSATIEVHPQHHARAVAFGANRDHLVARLETVMRQTVSSLLSAHILFLNREEAIRILRGACDAQLLEIGFMLSSLEFLPLSGGSWQPNFSENDIQVSITDWGSEKELLIISSLEMNLVDLGAYIRKDHGDLRAWVIATITTVTREVLLAEGYAAFVVDQAKLLGLIKDRITAEFQTSGYSITQYISTPKIDFDSLRSPFEVEEQPSFKTRYNYTEVSLSYKVRASIPDLSSIRNLIERPASSVATVFDEIKARTRKAIEKQLEVRPAEQFIFYFDSPYQAAGNEILREVLLAAIEVELSRDNALGLKDLDLYIDFGESQLRNRFDDLCREPIDHRFTFVPAQVSSYGDRYDINFTIDLEKVLEQGWSKMRLHTKLPSKEEHIDLIRKRIVSAIQALLTPFDHQSILLAMGKQHASLISEIRQVIKGTLADSFGLVGRIEAWVSDIGGHSEYSGDLEKAHGKELNRMLEHHETLLVSSLDDKRQQIESNKEAIRTMESRRLKLRSLPPSFLDESDRQELAHLEKTIPELKSELEILEADTPNPLKSLPFSSKPLPPHEPPEPLPPAD